MSRLDATPRKNEVWWNLMLRSNLTIRCKRIVLALVTFVLCTDLSVGADTSTCSSPISADLHISNTELQKLKEREIASNKRIKFLQRVGERVINNWECGDLPEFAKVDVRFKLDSCGYINDVHLLKELPWNQAVFNSLEAIAECDRFANPGEDEREFGFEFRNQLCRNNWNCSMQLKHSQETIVLHLIPLDALQSVPNLDSNLVHAKSNLRIMQTKDITSEAFIQFRKAWAEFLHQEQPISEGDVLAKAKELDSLYGKNLFYKESTEGSLTP